MKVYELAKEKKLESKEMVAICAQLGFEIKPQNKLKAEQLEALQSYFQELEAPAKKAAVTPTPAPVKKVAKKTVKKPLEPVRKTIAYIVTECEPFTSLGDLGEKTVASVRETASKGDQAIIVLPKYKNLNMGTSSMEWVMDIPVYVGGTMHRASLHRLTGHGVTYLFVGNETFFERENIYGYDDDLARFSFFNRAVLEILPYLGVKINEIHVNDWHTSIFSLIQKVAYKDHPYYRETQTVLNINDLSYQGWYDASILPNILGIDGEYYHNGLTRMGDAVNILKSGIETADLIRLTEKSKLQMTLDDMVNSGISYVLNHNLKTKAI